MTSSLSLFAYYKNLNISITKEDVSKLKTPFIFISKSLKISSNYVLLHGHFKYKYCKPPHSFSQKSVEKQCGMNEEILVNKYQEKINHMSKLMGMMFIIFKC